MGVYDFILENFNRDDFSVMCFLDEFRNIISQEFGISREYLTHIRSNSRLNHIAHYSAFRSEIIFNFDKIRAFTFKLYKAGVFKSVSEEHVRYMFFRVILHEVAHAYLEEFLVSSKFRFYKDASDVILGEYDLRGKSRIFGGFISSAIYKAYHDFFPNERFCELFSLDAMGEVLANGDFVNISDFVGYYVSKAFYGYDFKNERVCPLMKFYKILNRTDLYRGLDFSRVDYISRFLYGASVREDEIKTIYDSIVSNDRDKTIIRVLRP